MPKGERRGLVVKERPKGEKQRMARLLVIDDDTLTRKAWKVFLEQAGHEVSVAENGKEGCRVFQEQGADLIITDIVMPEMDGLEVIMKLWRDHPEVKVIAVSGGTDRLSAAMCLTNASILGALRTLEKPLRGSELVAAVAELLAAPA